MNELNIYDIKELSTLAPEQIKDYVKGKVFVEGEDGVKIYQFFALISKTFDLIKEDKELKESIENSFLRHCIKGEPEKVINGFKCKVYDRVTKEDFDSLQDVGYLTIKEEIARLKGEQKQCENYLRQNFAVPTKRTTIIEIGSHRAAA